MAAGAGGAAGGSFESTVDRKFLSVTNTMDSIQGLSTWCIDNKKYHSLVVRRWIKCLKKSDASHKLNLFYLANDVIQNCKRKNAIVYRTAFADVLPEAFSQINNDGDAKVIKSVERILTIWEDRSVYSGALITELRNSLVKEESPPETPAEQKTPVESKADIQSKIVAEFVPQALIDQLSKYKRSLEEVDLREKQLAAMRVDIFSSEALKKLKDKAGGKKFSRDFEEGSAQLQEFVKFFDRQSKVGPPLLEALSNADIFYEMQYKEVKIVANAYQTFANRVSHLKRKLDNLKSTLPDLDESPIPSPSADAPSPTGSESPFHGLSMASPDPDIDGSALDDDAERPAPSPLSSPGGSPKITENLGEDDNREVEDMELSDEETVSGGIIEEKVECPAQPKLSVPVPAKVEPLVPMEKVPPRVTAPAAAPAVSTEAVDLAKIGSILNSLSSVIKTTDSPSALDTIPTPTMEDANSLVNLLSQVDMSPAELLSALSKVQGPGGLEGISSLLSSPVTDSSSTGKSLPPPSSTSVSAAPSQSSSLSSAAGLSASTSAAQRSSSTRSRRPPQTSPAPTPAPAPAPTPAPAQNLHINKDSQPEPANPESLESKIHNFLHGNPAFSNFDLGFSVNSSHGGENLSPVTGTDAQDGTPVRDEGGGTPTLDEIMDKPANPSSVGESVNAAHIPYQSSTQQSLDNAQQPPHSRPGAAQNGQLYQPYKYGAQDMANHAITTPAAHYPPMSAQSGGSASGEGAPGGASSAQTHEGFHGVSERGWYGESYPEGGFQQPPGYNVTRPVVTGDKQSAGLYPFQANQTQEAQELQGASSSTSFFSNFLPPVPKLPPPPNVFNIATSTMIPAEQKQPAPSTGELNKSRGDSIISGMVVHDHEHKSLFRPEDPPYDLDKRRRHPEDHERYHEGPHRQDPQFFPDAPFSHPDEAYPPPGSPPSHYPRGRAPPHSPSEEGYYAHDYQRHSPPHPHFAPRRPPPHPHLEMRFPGMRPPHRPIHPAHHPHPRGPPGPPRPPFPPFHGPDPRLRGKRPGPRGGMNLGPMFPPKRPFPPPRF